MAALGLHVLSADGRRLRYGEGLARTWKVLLYGMALSVPLINIYRFWKSYRTCTAGETLECEWDSTQTLKDEKVWRAATYVGVFAFSAFLMTFAALVAEQPANRDEVSVAQFAENYDRYMDYYDINNGRCLNDAGAWVEQHDPNVYYFNGYEEPTYSSPLRRHDGPVVHIRDAREEAYAAKRSGRDNDVCARVCAGAYGQLLRTGYPRRDPKDQRHAK